jgi:PA14 domain
VGRWHVTFSRLGLATVTTPFFVLITFYFLFRAVRTKKPLDFGLGGVALGLGLDFHPTFWVVPIAVILFFDYWVIRSVSEGSTSSSPRILWIINLAVFLLGAGLTVAPVAQYALREPDIFWERTNQVSIFQTRDEPDLGRALVSNAVEHILMFNYQGDRNGRHNLPGEPMLDPISAVLFVLGLGLALRRVKQPAEFSFLVIFLVGLSAGIFSVDFESPQAQRSVTALPAVYFFTSLAVESIWKVLQRSGTSQIRRFFLIASLLVAGGGVIYLNAYTYFVRQANDPQAWGAHDPVETLTGIALRKLDPEETTVYLSMFLQNNAVIQFLAPNFEDTKTILPPDVVPLREPGDKSVALFIDREQDWVVGAVRDLYPGASQSVFSDPTGNPALYEVLVSPEEIRAIQGLTGRYWAGSNLEEEPRITETDKTLDVNWLADAPISLPFKAEWVGILYIPQFGQYQLQLESPGEGTVWVDEALVLQKESATEQTIDLQLSQGNHTLRVRAAGGEGLARLAWRSNPEDDFETIPASDLYLSPPVFSNGLVGSYYAGGDWDAQPAFVRIDPFIDMYFHIVPLSRPYGVEWEGEIEIPTTGEYEFGLRVNGEAQLFINGELVVDASQPTEYMGGTINLVEGRNRLRLRFLDYLGASRIHLYWTKPGDVQSIIPSAVLFPKR